MKRSFLILILSIIVSFIPVFSNEKIGSILDSYYMGLSLLNNVDRPFLNFRSYSSNNWDKKGINHPWQNISEVEPVLDAEAFSLLLLPAEWFQSYNLNSPHGINDGGLWQGKGYNTALSFGLELSTDHLELVFSPEVYFSQNLTYIIRNSATSSEWGYFYSGIDAPQRFGNESFWDFSWGQTQIRYKWSDWTVGFGTENFWLGTSGQTAIVMSNNADGFPHLDIGLNRHSTSWGDVEFRYWWGALKSSEYIETVEKNSYQDFLSGVSLGFSPVFLPYFSFGLHKTTQLRLEDFSAYSLIAAIDPGLIKDFKGGEDMGVDGSDGRASVTWSWMNPGTGFEFYGEFAMEDYIPSAVHLLRRPDHASGFVLGVRQYIPLKKQNDRFFLFNTEFSSLVFSRDYYLNGVGWGSGFYRNSQINLGFANEGQVLGAGYGPGGNSQHFELDYYAPFGMAGIYLTRIKWDDTSMYSPENISDNNEEWDVPLQMAVGLKTALLQFPHLVLSLDGAYIYDLNFAMIDNLEYHGFSLAMSLQYRY